MDSHTLLSQVNLATHENVPVNPLSLKEHPLLTGSSASSPLLALQLAILQPEELLLLNQALHAYKADPQLLNHALININISPCC